MHPLTFPSLKIVISSIPKLHSRFDAFDKLIAGFESSMPNTDTAKQKVKDFIGRMLSIFTDPEASCHILKRNDTEAMTAPVRRFGEQSIIPILKASVSQSGVVVAFLAKLYTDFKSQPREQQSKREIRSVFRNVLAIFIPSFKFPEMQSQRANDECQRASLCRAKYVETQTHK